MGGADGAVLDTDICLDTDVCLDTDICLDTDKICIQCRENEIYKLHKKHTQNKYARKKSRKKTFYSAL